MAFATQSRQLGGLRAMLPAVRDGIAHRRSGIQRLGHANSQHRLCESPWGALVLVALGARAQAPTVENQRSVALRAAVRMENQFRGPGQLSVKSIS